MVRGMSAGALWQAQGKLREGSAFRVGLQKSRCFADAQHDIPRTLRSCTRNWTSDVGRRVAAACAKTLSVGLLKEPPTIVAWGLVPAMLSVEVCSTCARQGLGYRISTAPLSLFRGQISDHSHGTELSRGVGFPVSGFHQPACHGPHICYPIHFTHLTLKRH
jgi:hypothetical protein